MNHQKLLEQIRTYVLTFLNNHADARLIYHSTAHTTAVVASVTQIANHYQLNDDDFFAVSAAAWFHDTGYGLDLKDHEAKSIELATQFLTEHKVKPAIITKIEGCIQATKMPQKPTNQLEEILCDADLFHLGTDEFAQGSKKLRKEMEDLGGKEIDKNDWRQRNIELLQKHSYFTDYCRLLLDDRKQKNLDKLLDKQQKKEDEPDDQEPGTTSPAVVNAPVIGNVAITQPADTAPAEAKKGKKDKGKQEERKSKGVETMFRISSGNQQRLSYMADSKAHIMISVNSIIISLLISLLLRKVDEHPHQVIPAIVLLAVNLTTIVFAILATRPNITQGTFTPEDIQSRKVNLLFFGNFFKMEFDKYEAGMIDMMNDNEFLYGSLIKDLYSQGVVLGRKYHLLRLSYNVFMYGLIISVIAFVISSTVA